MSAIARLLLALLRESSAELARAKRAPEARRKISALVASFFDALILPD